jgi:hypothetical protein
VVPPGGNSLKHKPRFAEIFRVLALPELVGGEAIAVCGEALSVRLESVGGVKPGLCVEVFLYAFDLGVKGFGDEEVGAIPEVFYETLGRSARWCGEC